MGLDKKILLVLGDSYAAQFDWYSPTHWIAQFADSADLEIVALGLGGSGSEYAIEQFFKYVNAGGKFDMMLTCWSEASRLYHPEVPVINTTIINSGKAFRKSTTYTLVEKVRHAAKEYYSHFYREDLANIHLTGLLQWFDEYLVSNYPNKLYWHFYCFPGLYNNSYADLAKKEDQYIGHVFKSGVTMYPTLSYFSFNDPNHIQLQDDLRAGHLSTDQHTQIFLKLQTLYNSQQTDGVYFLDNDFDQVKLSKDTFEGRFP